MAINKTKPSPVVRSKIVDQTVTKFLLFGDLDVTLDTTDLFADYQTKITGGTLQVLEVYGLTPSSAESGTIEIGGIVFQTKRGEKRYAGDVMTTYSSALADYSYYSGKGVFLISADDVIRGIPNGNDTISPFPLNQVVGGDKEPGNDGTTASTPKIMFNIDGKSVLKADEWCLGFEFDSIVVPTV